MQKSVVKDYHFTSCAVLTKHLVVQIIIQRDMVRSDHFRTNEVDLKIVRLIKYNDVSPTQISVKNTVVS